ncbi:MAG: hypothetical protein ACOX2S_03460 [bacterium]
MLLFHKKLRKRFRHSHGFARRLTLLAPPPSQGLYINADDAGKSHLLNPVHRSAFLAVVIVMQLVLSNDVVNPKNVEEEEGQ